MKATAAIVGGGGVMVAKSVRGHEVETTPRIEETLEFLDSDITVELLYRLTRVAWEFSKSILAPEDDRQYLVRAAFDPIRSLRYEKIRYRISNDLDEYGGAIIDSSPGNNLTELVGQKYLVGKIMEVNTLERLIFSECSIIMREFSLFLS